MKNKREFYRIRYPLSCRPRLILLDKEYEVIETSEKGVKFLHKKFHEFQIGLTVGFTITFHDDESLDLEGKILRVDENVVVVYLSEEIPFRRIALEQRHIIDNYPDYFFDFNTMNSVIQ